MNRNDKYLAHYGILGMKWGVRRYQNPDGSLTSAGQKRYQKKQKKASKKEEREVEKQINKRNTDLFIKSHNYAADRINGEWLEEFNNKWGKVFEGHTDWRDSPKYTEYENAYIKKVSDLMGESLSNNPNAKFTTKLGNTYTARYLEKNGNIVWATQKEWDEYDKKR